MAKTDKEILAALEPEVDGMPQQLAVQVSLAISMKRIADAISYDSKVSENLFDVIRGIRDR
jgi:hypothetical protein